MGGPQARSGWYAGNSWPYRDSHPNSDQDWVICRKFLTLPELTPQLRPGLGNIQKILDLTRTHTPAQTRSGWYAEDSWPYRDSHPYSDQVWVICRRFLTLPGLTPQLRPGLEKILDLTGTHTPTQTRSGENSWPYQNSHPNSDQVWVICRKFLTLPGPTPQLSHPAHSQSL
jgi:hypothetical protein